jgi:hypothetical protein
MEINIIMSFTLFFYLYLIILDTNRKNKVFFSPITFTLVPWSFVLILHILPLIESGYYALQWRPLVFILIANILFILPTLLLKVENNMSCARISTNDNQAIYILISFISIVAVVGVSFEIIGKISVYSIDYSSGLRNAREQIEVLGMHTFQRPMFMKIGLLLSGLWGPLLFIGLLVAERMGRLNQILLLFMAVSGIALSFISLGRVLLLATTIIFILAILIRKTCGYTFLPKVKIFKFTLLLVIAICIFGVLIVFAVRSGQYKMNSIYQIENGMILKTQYNFAFIIDSFPPFIQRILFLFIYYFSCSLYHFGFMWENTVSGPYYGLFTLPPIISSQLKKIGLTELSGVDIQWEVLKDYSSFGRPSRVFRTAYDALIYDFGAVGAFVVTLVFGFLYAKSFRRFMENKTIGNALPLMVWSQYAITGIFYNGFIQGSIFFMAFYSFLLSYLIKKHGDISLIK